MIDINLSRTLKTVLDAPNLIYLAFISVFLPYYVTAAVIIVTGLYLLISRNTRGLIFVHRGRGVFLVFTLYTAVVALVFQNYIGLACSAGFFLIIVISYYARSIMTEEIFEKGLDICCFAAIPLGLAAAVEKIINLADEGYRCKLWFFNENYFCAIMAAVIIACAFKATSHRGGVLIYYICALFAGVAMYLGESLFAFVELFVGIFVLLILKRKHTLLAIFLMLVVFCMLAIYFVPEIMPRLAESNVTSDRRVRIWNTAMQFIGENPFFGRGFLSYFQLAGMNPKVYQTTHAHNFALEPLISFGIVGTLLLIIFMWTYYEKVTECKELLRSNHATTFILTISAAIIAHATTDMTMLWIQTGLLYGLFLGGVGADEKTLNRRIQACLAKDETKNSQEE